MDIKRNILITGAGGFLGFEIAKSLLKIGYNVINFSRNKHQKLIQIGIKTIIGNLENYQDVLRACKNCHVVFHVASKVGVWGSYDSFHKTNVIGTQNIIQACKHNNIQYLVYTSTPSVVFNQHSLCNVDEVTKYATNPLTNYAKTKIIAEKMVLNSNSLNFKTVALRPHLIFGKDDPNLIPRILNAAKRNKLKIIGDGTNLVDVIYVKNAANAHVQAFLKLNSKNFKNVSGKAYFIGQEKPVVLWDFINQILQKNNIKPIKDKINFKTAYYLGALIEIFYKITNQETMPPMTRFIALQLGKSHFFSHNNAFKDFGYVPNILLDDAIEKTVS